MTQVTHTELQELIDNSALVAGDTYEVTDYPGYYLSMTAVSEKELSDEAVDLTIRSGLVFHYVPSTNTVDYMKDTYRRIEGYFDWSENVTGTCSDIYFGDSDGLYVENCSHIHCIGTATGTLSDSQNVVIGESSEVYLVRCNNITVGEGNTLTLTDCSTVDIADWNTLTLSDLDGVSIADRNEDLTISGTNVIGSDNSMITVNGDSNVVKSGNIDVEIQGSCNSMDRTKYVAAYGSYNTTDKTTLATLDIAYGNEVKNSHSVDIKNTNNNIVRTDAIEIKDKPAFVKYATTGAVRRVENLTQRTNMQADSTATTLIMDEEKMWQSSDTKANRNYVIIDGQWVDVNNI